ncbi:MAG: hypothetical protein EZS28_050453, partial [Streblomastix strix]
GRVRCGFSFTLKPRPYTSNL